MRKVKPQEDIVRVPKEDLPQIVQAFSYKVERIIHEELFDDESTSYSDIIGCLQALLVVGIDAMYWLQGSDPTLDDKMWMDEHSQRVFSLACELARERCWGERVS